MLLVCERECEWMNANLYFKNTSSGEKTSGVLHKCSLITTDDMNKILFAF